MFNFVMGAIDFAHKIDKPTMPQEEYFKHMHSFVEVLYFIDGDVTYTVDSKSRKLQPGDIVFIAPGRYHFATVNLDDVPYERYVLKFPEVLIPDYLKNTLFSDEPFFLSSPRCSGVFYSLDWYYDDFSDRDLYHIFLGKIYELLVMISKSVPSEKEEVNSLVDRITEYVNAHISEPISLKSLSNDLMYSQSYISNEFKKSMHISVMMYVRLKKVVYANTLIQGGMKKGAAAEKAGFLNYSTFYRDYRSLFGKYGELLDAEKNGKKSSAPAAAAKEPSGEEAAAGELSGRDAGAEAAEKRQ